MSCCLCRGTTEGPAAGVEARWTESWCEDGAASIAPSAKRGRARLVRASGRTPLDCPADLDRPTKRSWGTRLSLAMENLMSMPSMATLPMDVYCLLSPCRPLPFPPEWFLTQPGAISCSPFQLPPVATRSPNRARVLAFITTQPGPLLTGCPLISYGGSR